MKAQQAEDRKRKEKEYKERKEKERKERKEKEEKEKQEGKTGTDETPVMPASNAKALDGEPIAPVFAAEPPSDKAIIAIPVITPSDTDSINKNQQDLAPKLLIVRPIRLGLERANQMRPKRMQKN